MTRRYFERDTFSRAEAKREILAYVARGYSKAEIAALVHLHVRTINRWALQDPAFGAALAGGRLTVAQLDPEVDTVVRSLRRLSHGLRNSIRQAQELGLWVQVTHGHDSTSVEVWMSPERCTTAIDKDRSIRLLRDTEIT